MANSGDWDPAPRRPGPNPGRQEPSWQRPDRPAGVFPTYPGLGGAASGTPHPSPAGRGRQVGRGRSVGRGGVSGAVLAGRVAALLAATVVLLGAGLGWAVTGSIQSGSGTSDAAANAGNSGVVFQGGLTILLVGSDARTDANGNPLTAEELAPLNTQDDGGGVNTDTLMLVHIPQGGGTATAVSLPRDTWIGPTVMNQVLGPYADGTQGPYQPNKINSFYSTAKTYTAQHLADQGVTDQAQIERDSNEAGRTMLIRVVQAFTGMKIDHYAEVNLLGFYLLSTAIGGVPVCLNQATQDSFSGADFPAGPQDVQGSSALAFVRQRHGLPNGDLDRVRRQQAFLAGAVSRILSVGTLTDPAALHDLVTAVNRSVVFDKDFSVLTFAEQLTNLAAGNFTFTTLPTTGPEPSTTTDALATDPAQLAAFFQTITGDPAGTTAPATSPASVDPAGVTVDVKDGTVADGVTSYTAATIRRAGFTLGSLGVVTGTRPGHEQHTTEIHYPTGGRAAAEQVKTTLTVGTLVPDDTIPTGHLLVIVGTDLTVPRSGLHAPAAAPTPPPAAATPAVNPAPATAASLTASPASSVPCVN